jgi:ABC-type transporter MlaC component
MSRKETIKKLHEEVSNHLQVLQDFTIVLRKKETISELKRLHRRATGRHSNTAHFNSMFRYMMGKYPRNASKAELAEFTSKFSKILKTA